MCGIAGRFHPEHLPPAPGWHERASTRLQHRGPDGAGHYVDSSCEFVHRRLALIDLSPTGHQPMPNEDGSVYVIFNGEVYNHPALRAEMKAKGHTFRGGSDTEVLVHLYEEYGEGMVERLRGMFAFAIYDRVRRKLLLARDRFGIKPLYYTLRQDQCVFASEMKAILALEGFHPTLDRQACYDYLGLTYIPEPATGFREIQALPKGSLLVIDARGHRQTQFFKPHAEPRSDRTLDQTVDLVSESLLRSVQGEMVADVPVAALLSGGIDSSLVVAAYCKVSKEPPTTFNVRFPDAAFDETAMATEVSRHLGTRHETIDVNDSDIEPESLLRLFRQFDQPFADTSLIPMYWVAQAIRDHGIICVLSGDGGDEAFGGYSCFWQANRLFQLMRLPGWAQTAAAFAGQRFSSFTNDFGRQLAKAALIAQEGRRDSALLLSSLANYLNEDQKHDLVPGAADDFEPAFRHFNGYVPPGASTLEELSRRMTENQFAVSLPSNMLHRADMMSMLASIEIRVPLLDEEVVGVGLQVPHTIKTDGKQGKLALRELAARWLPRSVAAHPKHGFCIPLDRLVTDQFYGMLADTLLSPSARISAFFNIPLVTRWLELFRQAKHGRPTGELSREGLYQRIFSVLALEMWLRDHNLSW